MSKNIFILSLFSVLSICSASVNAQFGDLENAIKSLTGDNKKGTNKVDRFADTSCRDMIEWVEENKKRKKRKKRLSNHENCSDAFTLIKKETPQALDGSDWGKFRPILFSALETIENQEMERIAALNKPKEDGSFLICSGPWEDSSFGDTVSTLVYLDAATRTEVDIQEYWDGLPLTGELRICSIKVHHNDDRQVRNSQNAFSDSDWNANPIDQFLNKATVGCTDAPNGRTRYRNTGFFNDAYYYWSTDGGRFFHKLNRKTQILYRADTYSSFDCSITDASDARKTWNKIYSDQRATHARLRAERTSENSI